MRIQCDDELFRVDRVFLGPKGKPWPLRATYRAYVLWGFLAVGSLVLWRMIGLPWHMLVLAAIPIVTYPLATWIDKKLNADRPFLSELWRAWQELVAPRPALHPEPFTRVHGLKAERWKADAPPARRWWSRAKSPTAGRGGRVYRDGEWTRVR